MSRTEEKISFHNTVLDKFISLTAPAHKDSNALHALESLCKKGGTIQQAPLLTQLNKLNQQLNFYRNVSGQHVHTNCRTGRQTGFSAKNLHEEICGSVCNRRLIVEIIV